MPLKLNVGLSRKVGEPNYGSRGASINVELELDSAIAGEPDRLHERIRQMFSLAKQSIDEELHLAAPTTTAPPAGNSNSAEHNRRHTPPRSAPNGNSHSRGSQRGASPPPATASQARALYAIAKSQRLDLAALLRERFHLEQAEGLNIAEASALIDELKGTATTSGGRR